ncbi:Copia protein, partial [Durusdinium trenchii]
HDYISTWDIPRLQNYYDSWHIKAKYQVQSSKQFKDWSAPPVNAFDHLKNHDLHPSLTAGQFADEVQADIFYARLLDGTSFAVLGIVDKATGFHQAGYMPDRNATTAFQVLSDIWLRPFGLPLRFVCDPDHTFRGQFEQRLMAMGVMVEHCPPEAHYIIGMVERRNAILRLTLEKVIDQLGVVSLDQVPTVLTQACHSINSLPFTRGRSGYQAVFGRTPRLPDDVLTDTQVLSTSTQPFRDVDNPGLRAELVRSEAMKALIDLNAQQQFRRALLRKTRNVKVPELLPGQRCAVWRWTKKGDPPQDQESLQNIAEQQAAAALLPVPEDHELDMHLEEYTPSIPDVPDATEQFEQDEQATATEPAAAAEQAAATAEQTAAAADTGQTTEHTEPGPMQEEDPLPVLPLKRPFDTLFIMEENGTLARAEHHWGGTPPMAYGTTSKAFFKVYAMTKQRQQDINNTDKAAAESDTTVDSDSGDSSTEQAERPKYHNPGMSRQERKQLDREIPWRHILTMPPAYIDKFLAAIDKETNSWSEWRSVKPLSREEAQAVLRDKILSKRVLRSRACYRDKNVGQGEVKAKCRIVCLGHQDPDLEVLNRSSPTPGRTSEMVMYAMIVAGMNQELFDTQKPWLAWAGDAQTAFLQGKQKDSERPLPLYMRLPKDGLIEKTGHWRSDLYQILGNVYGLSNAPHLWSEEDIPFTKDSLVLGYSDASWCNASRSGSQIGLVIGITSMEAKQKPVKFTPLDWRSSRAPRVCRSTLAAEACAADEAADRGAYLNRIISELIYAQPSHRVGCRMSYAQATDARSLYDAIMAEAPNISDKRSLVSVRSVQEVVDTHQLHWVPTTLQFADGLTKADVNLRNVCRAWFEDPRAVLADHPENQKLLEQLGAKVNKTKTSEKLAP